MLYKPSNCIFERNTKMSDTNKIEKTYLYNQLSGNSPSGYHLSSSSKTKIFKKTNLNHKKNKKTQRLQANRMGTWNSISILQAPTKKK